MNLITYKNKNYPIFQSQGNASQFAIPFAKHFCFGIGYDIPIDLTFNELWSATNLPKKKNGCVDYIFSSHCLEHIDNWVDVLDYWYDNIKPGGILFLYLPHYNQEYWRPWNNKKHKHVFNTIIIVDYMKNKGYKNIFSSERDLNDSFIVVGEK